MNSADCRRWRLLPPLWGKVGMGGRAVPTRLALLGLSSTSFVRRQSAKARASDLFQPKPNQRRRSALVAFRLKASRASDANPRGMA
jgi:hypothetical protein